VIKLLSIICLVLAIVLFPPAALALVSNNAVPGDATYPIKSGEKKSDKNEEKKESKKEDKDKQESGESGKSKSNMINAKNL